jgi:hypothetical protein
MEVLVQTFNINFEIHLAIKKMTHDVSAMSSAYWNWFDNVDGISDKQVQAEQPKHFLEVVHY